MQAVAMPGSDPCPPISVFSLSPGRRLGKFEIVRALAAGGMGKIYLARDTLTGADVALKVLIPAPDAEPARVDRFKRESLICQRLNHPNIIRIYDIGEDAGFYFISMEVLDGEDLQSFLVREPRPDLTRIAGISLQVLAGLEFAHEQGIVHRDFKPQNIFLTRAGSVKLLDFGVAQALRISSHTTPGSMVGTPGYMSPEQAQGKPDLDGRSDIYSWGVVLYQMLTGRLPFRGDSPIGVAAAHVYETPPPVRDLEPQVPLGLAAVVMRCLEKYPSARYADVAELRDAFEAAMVEAGVPIAAVAAAIQNARTPTPKSAVGVPLGRKTVATSVPPKRLREALVNDPGTTPTSKTKVATWLVVIGSGIAAVTIWTAFEPGRYRCEAAQRIEVGDLSTVQASILSAGASRMSRACSIQAQAGLALIHSHIGEANEKVRAALSIEPELVWANVINGDLVAQTGDLDVARHAYEKATTAKIGTAPERAIAWARLARLALAESDVDGASRYLDGASRTGASIPEVQHLLAQVAAKRNDLDTAANQYAKAIQIAPNDAVAQILLDDVRVRQQSQADVERQRSIAEMIERLDARTKASREGMPLPPVDWKAGDRRRVISVLPLESGAAAAMMRAGLGDALMISLERALAGLDQTKVVDRQILDHVLSEQLLGTSSIADGATALQVGRILSVRYLVRPQLTRLDETLVFNVRVIDVETTEIVASASPEVPIDANPADVIAAAVRELEPRLRAGSPSGGS